MLRLGIDALGLSLKVGILDECRANLLVAVRCKLILERLQRVQVGILGSLHLHLVVDEEIHIFLNALLVDDTVGVVLIVGILKFRTQHGLPVDGHHHGVVLCLCAHCRCCKEQGSKKDFSHTYFINY